MNNLQSKITNECQNIQKVLTKTEQILSLISTADEDNYFDSFIMALTLCLENFYMGVERVFSFIAKAIDGVMLSSEIWHIQLLKQMSLEMPSVRPAVISQATYESLNEFRGFRHVARNLYVYDLDPQRVIELA